MAVWSSLWLLLLVPLCQTDSRIKHVVVLMEENRSFDHLFGFYTRTKVNGLTGKEFNLVDPSNPQSKQILVDQQAPDLNSCDPDHGLPATSSKIFDYASAHAGNFTNPTMSGFIEWENRRNNSDKNWCGVMSTFSEDHVPVISALAAEFALMDRFFCSVPGPTWPNRMFALSATSFGLTETGPWYQDKVGQFFPQKTLFDQVAEANLTWKNYYNDTPWEMFMNSIAHSPDNLIPMEQFWEDARTGNLPSFAWINPRSGINVTTGVGSNDMHPDHDMNAGEQYYKDIYEALRASPQWNSTLLIITMDEHGGFYDHVPPPMNIPPPDAEPSFPDSFKFDRLGIRVPTLLISPWIKKGTVLSKAPTAQSPSADSEYEHSSLPASVRKLLDGMQQLPPLTKRDAWASTFEHIVTELAEPRTDCPVHLPDARPPHLSSKVEASLPVNDLQQHIATVLSHLSSQSSIPHPRAGAPPLKEQGHVSEFAQYHLQRHRTHHRFKTHLKAANKYEVVCKPLHDPELVMGAWSFVSHPSFPFASLHTRTLTPPLCLAADSLQENATLSVLNCTDAMSPDNQSWVLRPDATLRPALAPNMCVTNHQFNGDYLVRLSACSPAVNQRWAFHGPAPGNDNGGYLFFGDDLNGLALRLAK